MGIRQARVGFGGLRFGGLKLQQTLEGPQGSKPHKASRPSRPSKLCRVYLGHLKGYFGGAPGSKNL